MVTIDFHLETSDDTIEHALPKPIINADGSFLIYQRERQTGDVFARDKYNDYVITCPIFETGRNGDHRYCKGPTYNPGLAKYFCSGDNEHKCATYKYNKREGR
jgi:hypothetical protein